MQPLVRDITGGNITLQAMCGWLETLAGRGLTPPSRPRRTPKSITAARRVRQHWKGLGEAGFHSFFLKGNINQGQFNGQN